MPSDCVSEEISAKENSSGTSMDYLSWSTLHKARPHGITDAKRS
jgi:hypothetical protein